MTGRVRLVIACVAFDLIVLAYSVSVFAIMLIIAAVVAVGIAGWIVDGDHVSIERDGK